LELIGNHWKRPELMIVVAAHFGRPGARVCDPQEYRPHQTTQTICGYRPHLALVYRQSHIENPLLVSS